MSLTPLPTRRFLLVTGYPEVVAAAVSPFETTERRLALLPLPRRPRLRIDRWPIDGDIPFAARRVSARAESVTRNKGGI